MRTFVINIPTRDDRRQMMDKQLHKNGFEIPEEGKKNEAGFVAPDLRVEWTTHMKYNILGSDITDEWLEENDFGLFDWRIDQEVANMLDDDVDDCWWSRDLTKGEIGCALSHWGIWKECENYDKPIMILEDDALFKPDMELKREIDIATLEVMGKNWDILYLGRYPVKSHLEERLTETIVIPEFSYCAHAYCVSPKGIKRLLDYNLQKSIIPLDEFIPATYVEHPRTDVSLKYPPSLIVYAMDPVIVKQRPKAEVGSDTGLPPAYVPKWDPDGWKK